MKKQVEFSPGMQKTEDVKPLPDDHPFFIGFDQEAFFLDWSEYPPVLRELESVENAG